jgi:toxin ParE1/3/4
MRRFRYSRLADSQLVDIAKFSIELFGRVQTKRYLRGIETAIARAVRDPKLMRARPEIGAGLFSVRCSSHVAFLIKPSDTKQWLVVGVLHGHMDPARHLGGAQDEQT